MLPFLPMQYQMSQYLFYIQSQSFVHILPFNLHKIMFIFWMSNVFLILPWYLFFRQCCLLSGILAESSVYFRRKNYSSLREYSAYIFVEVVVYVILHPDIIKLKFQSLPWTLSSVTYFAYTYTVWVLPVPSLGEFLVNWAKKQFKSNFKFLN